MLLPMKSNAFQSSRWTRRDINGSQRGWNRSAEAEATLGETVDVMRAVFGAYEEPLIV